MNVRLASRTLALLALWVLVPALARADGDGCEIPDNRQDMLAFIKDVRATPLDRYDALGKDDPLLGELAQNVRACDSSAFTLWMKSECPTACRLRKEADRKLSELERALADKCENGRPEQQPFDKLQRACRELSDRKLDRELDARKPPLTMAGCTDANRAPGDEALCGRLFERENPGAREKRVAAEKERHEGLRDAAVRAERATQFKTLVDVEYGAGEDPHAAAPELGAPGPDQNISAAFDTLKLDAPGREPLTRLFRNDRRGGEDFVRDVGRCADGTCGALVAVRYQNAALGFPDGSDDAAMLSRACGSALKNVDGYGPTDPEFAKVCRDYESRQRAKAPAAAPPPPSAPAKARVASAPPSPRAPAVRPPRVSSAAPSVWSRLRGWASGWFAYARRCAHSRSS